MSSTATDKTTENLKQADALFEAVRHISGESQTLLQNFMARQPHQLDALGLQQAYMDLTTALMKNPEKMVELQMQAWNSWVNLWMDTTSKMMGGQDKSAANKPKPDKRFKHDAWENNPFFDYIKQSYLLTAGTIQSIVNHAEGLDPKTAHKVGFYTKQFIDAMSPSNFLMTNPEVIEQTLQSKGENLLNGMKNFCKDFDPDSGKLRISMTNQEAFDLGKNIALSPGKVIFQNELMQLIQYAPTTAEVYKNPVLIIPPWINKFYILDLQPKNSLIKWLTEQGHTVFVISWVNPDASLGQKDFEDYIFDGPLAALEAIEQATGVKEVNAIGYCIGGTLLSATLAYMKTQQDRRIVSATFLVTLIDFSDPGDLGVFIDEQQISHLEQQMNERGYHEGREMAMAFNLLRANDLIWSFYVNNYLLGKEPMAFDLLYWNSDSTRMPARMHSTYLRTMYHENRFKEPGGFTVRGIPIDIRQIDTPAYFISTEEDHIAPWKSTYLGARLFSGPVRFVLGKSGHIAGVVNPPAAKKYGYYTGPAPVADAEQWYTQTEAHEGSWWPDWNNWVLAYAGDKVSARQPGAGKLSAIEEAPGSYVRVKS
jgi:polyhydroxyalkanoate synthase